MRRALLIALLLLPASADAKGLLEVEVCGADACRSIQVHRAFISPGVSAAAPGVGETFRLEYRLTHGVYSEIYRNGIRQYADGTWATLPARIAAQVDRAARPLQSLPTLPPREAPWWWLTGTALALVI